MWVEAKGKEVDGRLVVTEIEELKKSASSKADKVELTGEVESKLDDAGLTVLRTRFHLADKTTFEDRNREEVSPFPVESGDWVKIKARVKNDDLLQARTIRSVEPRKLFEVEGEITTLARNGESLHIGAIPLPIAPDVNVDTLYGVSAGDPLALFLADEQKGVPFSIRLTDTLRLGGELSGKGEINDEFDLDRSQSGDRTNTRIEGKLDLLWRLDDAGSFALIEGKVGRGDRFREGGDDTARRSDQISRAYAYLKLHESLRLQLGRQDFDEEREWLHDEILDGVRLRALLGPFELEAAAGWGREFLAENNPTEDTFTFTGLGRYHVAEDHRITAYVIQRKDTSASNFEPLHLGLRSYARPSKGLGHWLELAYATGYEGFTKFEGYAVDIGLMYRADLPLRPTLTLGHAFGSGKGDASSRMGFRQTGLQDNNAKFGGVTSFRYYGEVLEPELANLSVTTAGVGVRPVRNASIDVVFHTYRQDAASTTLVDTNLRTSPNGNSRDLGWGADLVLGYRLPWLSLEFIAGRFEPGDAFDRNDPAHKYQLQGRFKF
jgi:hypothetical protein